MIPYADLERALARWKIRQAGGEAPPEHPTYEVSGTAVLAEAYADEVVMSEPSGLIQIGEDEDR
jgi:hypothetical protein